MAKQQDKKSLGPCHDGLLMSILVPKKYIYTSFHVTHLEADHFTGHPSHASVCLWPESQEPTEASQYHHNVNLLN